MKGISSKALSFGEPDNKKRYQQYEFNSDFDINLYETFYRHHDPQIGRFWQLDPRPIVEMEGLYNAMSNNPISNIDILGDITYYYDVEGNLLHSQDDENDYATVTVISGKNLKTFQKFLGVIMQWQKESNGGITNKMAAGVLRTLGVSYDTKEFEDYYDKYSKDYYEGDVFKPTDGKGKLVNERMAGLKLKNGYLRLMDKMPHPSSDNPTESDTDEIRDRDIHTHTSEGRRFTIGKRPVYVKYGKAAFGDAAEVDGGDIRRGSYEDPGQEKYRSGMFNVVVTPTHVYLYRHGQVTIAIDRKKVPSKNPGEIK